MSHPPHGVTRPSVRVGMADDDPLVRRALSTILAAEDDLTLVWVVDHGSAAVEQVRAAAADPSLRVDVVLLDVQMPGIDGFEACRRIRAIQPELPVLMLTSFDPEANLGEALASGASGFVAKDDAADALGAIVRAASTGSNVFSPSARSGLRPSQSTPRSSSTDPMPLTERELEVVKLVSRSMTNHQVARALGISDTTVKSHVSAIITKLDCTDRVGMVAWAFRQGIID